MDELSHGSFEGRAGYGWGDSQQDLSREFGQRAGFGWRWMRPTRPAVLDTNASGLRTRRPRWVLCSGVVAVAVLLGAGLAWQSTESSIQRVMPGEFEYHDLLLVAWPTNQRSPEMSMPDLQQLVADIARAVEGSIDVAVLTIDEPQRQDAAKFLSSSGTTTSQVRFLQAPSQTIWVRDYGPLVTKSFRGGYETLNTIYRHSDIPELDDVPITLSGSLGWPVVDAPIVMENGNLVSNGAGLCVTTEKLVFANTRDGEPRSHVTKLLREYMGAEQVVTLENLVGEPNGHVDVFMAFTAADTAVVGEYSPAYDPENAEILDRNAQRLSELKTACGPLKVHRIPMPRRSDGHWRTFTNVVFANGVLLVPTYGTSYLVEEAQALAVYKQLLPTWKVVGIDCSYLIQGNGALHCVTMNVYRVASPDSSESTSAVRHFHDS